MSMTMLSYPCERKKLLVAESMTINHRNTFLVYILEDNDNGKI